MNPPLRLLLGGDVMLGRLVTRVLAEEGAAYPFAAISALIARAQLFLVNLECALSARRQRYAGPAKAFYFRAEPDAVRVLELAGVDLVSLANNHVMDAGSEGLVDTLTILEQHGVAVAGAGADLASAAAVRRLEGDGQQVGVLAVCDHQADFAATPQRAGIHYLDLQDRTVRNGLVERVRTEAAQVDHLVVSLHWLPNWVPSIPEAYRELAAELLDAGARVLWGHSPHHILGTEWRAGGVAIYSTGDLVDDYTLDEVFRNDRQLLYLLDLGAGRVERVCAYPIQLRIGCTTPPDADARIWIAHRLRDACRPLGSEVIMLLDEGFEIQPTSAAPTGDVAGG
ncbi:CapA family protein [Rhodanobacter ginsengisoli]|uniref:CapA family protein n=1 Tax=Rhodanobacter ginsengisoli TaxID=418646 RepID=A0ABW0QL37_9GAMM